MTEAEYKAKLIDIGEELVAVLDKIDSPTEQRKLVSWVANFWGGTTQDLASYSMCYGEMMEPARAALKKRFALHREMSKK